MLTCKYCGLIGSPEDGDFQLDTNNNQGFWCEDCDGFTYYDHIEHQHRFKLILEEKKSQSNILTVPKKGFNKRLSPYRYPGGKSKIIDYLYSHLQQNSLKKLISPFTGGGSFELAMLDSGVVEELHLNDLDYGVYSLWWTIKHMPYELIARIQASVPSQKDFFQAQNHIKNDYQGLDMIEAAWTSLLVNRLAYSGIFKANPLGGKKGKKASLLSRWIPEELIKRIKRIHSMSDQIEVTQLNAVHLIEEAYWEEKSILFIDPPYVDKGKSLYPCYYSEKDHRELAFLLDTLYQGCPGADIIVTYDYNEWLNNLYEFPETEVISRVYSA